MDATTALSATANPRPPRMRFDRWAAPAALLLVALALRWPQFGRLDLSDGQLDEQFYLLAGDRLLHGGWPIVDVWDRKPPGLFLIYAAARTLGGDGVLAYQLLAALFAAATAETIRRAARGHATRSGAMLAGVAYLAWLLPFQGGGGQSPVFYNLPVAIAGALALHAAGSQDRGGIARAGLIAAIAGGLAIQVKYTAGVEAAALCGCLLWRLARTGAPAPRLAGIAAAMAALGCLPTLIAIALYWIHGALGAFVYADFLSIADRASLPREAVVDGLLFVGLIGAPLFAILPAGVAALPAGRRATMLVWLAAAAAGFAAIGNFYHHYALPLLVPLLVAAAALLGRRASGWAVAAILVAWPLFCSQYLMEVRRRAEPDGVRVLAAAAAPWIGPQCLFVYDGPAALYLLTRSCLPSRIVYPDHFANAVEAHALGLDIVAETRRVLATRPVIVTADRAVGGPVNRATKRLVDEALARGYRRVAAVPVRGRTLFLDVPREARPHS